MEQPNHPTATLLFTDVVASTELANRVGDEAAQRLMRAHERVVREELGRHGGREVKTMGDGFMVAFPSPEGALSCAVAVQRRLAEEAPGVHVRMGLHEGEVVERNADLFGATVNAAARISAKARGTQILVSETLVPAAKALGDGVAVVDRGLFWLKGFPERWRLHELRWSDHGGGAPVSRARTPFVGRDAERADLREHLEEALGGHGSLVLVGGEPGVGKTRLAEELAWEADQRGMRVLTGHCSQMEGAPPYIAWVEILEQAIVRAQSPEGFRSLLGESAGEIARVVPELRRVYPDIPPPLDLPPEQERRYLFNSIRDFITRAAEMRPILLVLDDLHWADEPTLLLLEHVAQDVADTPLLILGTYRDVELEVDRPLARTLEELVRKRLAQRISLRRLPVEEVAEMLAGMADQRPPEEVVRVVYAETEGNAFFVEEVFRHLVEEGRLLDERGAWRADLRVREIDVPESVKLVIGRRLQRLSENARKLLTAAATIGRFFDVRLLEGVSGADEDALLGALEEGEDARLVAPSDASAERFEFAHELIRQTLLAGLSGLRRQRLHRKVAEAIESLLGNRAEERAEELAYHLMHAGTGADPEKLVRYLLAAGDRAMRAAAFEDALRHYDNAATLLSEEDAATLADVQVKVGFALRSLGRVDEGIAAWRRALDGYADVGDRHAVANLCADIGTQLGWSGRGLEGIEFVQRGLAAAGDEPTPARARLLVGAGTFLSYAGEYRAGAAMFDEAEPLIRDIGDRALLGTLLLARTMLHYFHMELPRAAEVGYRAATVCRDADSLWDLASDLGLLGWAELGQGRWEAAAAATQELDPLARRIGHQVALLLGTRIDATLRFLRSADLDAFEAFARRDLEFCREIEVGWLSQSYVWNAMVHLYRGRWDEAAGAARLAVESDVPGAFIGWAPAVASLVAALRGEADEVRRLLYQTPPALAVAGQPNTWGAWSKALLGIEALALVGDRERAAALYPVALEAMATGVVYRFPDQCPLAVVAGIAAGAGGLWDRAEDHFRAALDRDDGGPNDVARADTRRLFAQTLLLRDSAADRDRARVLLAEASDRYRRVGMPRHVQLTQTLLERAR